MDPLEREGDKPLLPVPLVSPDKEVHRERKIKRRRRAEELTPKERWNCPYGCGKFYCKTSTISVRRHSQDCPQKPGGKGPTLPQPTPALTVRSEDPALASSVLQHIDPRPATPQQTISPIQSIPIQSQPQSQQQQQREELLLSAIRSAQDTISSPLAQQSLIHAAALASHQAPEESKDIWVCPFRCGTWFAGASGHLGADHTRICSARHVTTSEAFSPLYPYLTDSALSPTPQAHVLSPFMTHSSFSPPPHSPIISPSMYIRRLTLGGDQHPTRHSPLSSRRQLASVPSGVRSAPSSPFLKNRQLGGPRPQISATGIGVGLPHVNGDMTVSGPPNGHPDTAMRYVKKSSSLSPSVSGVKKRRSSMPNTENVSGRTRSLSGGDRNATQDRRRSPTQLEKLEQIFASAVSSHSAAGSLSALPDFFPSLPSSPTYTTLPESLTKPELTRQKSSPGLQPPPLVAPKQSPLQQNRRISPQAMESHPQPQSKPQSQPLSPGLSDDSMHKMMTATMSDITASPAKHQAQEKSHSLTFPHELEFPLSPPPPFTMDELVGHSSSASPSSSSLFKSPFIEDLIEPTSLSIPAETVTSTPASDIHSISSFLSSPLSSSASHEFEFDFSSHMREESDQLVSSVCSPTSNHILSPIRVSGDSDDI